MTRPRRQSTRGGRAGRADGAGDDVPLAWHELLRAGGLVRRLAEPHFTRMGISPAQWGVLRALQRLSRRGVADPRMHELGAALLVQPPSLSATLDRMVRAGLVRREPDPDDHRSRRIALTGAGRDRVNNALGAHSAWVRSITAGLGTAELDRLASLLTRLNSHMMNQMDLPVPPPGVRAPARRRAPRKRS